MREWYLPQGLSPRELSLDLSMKHNESRQSLLFSDFSIGMDFFFDYFFGYFFFMIAILVWIHQGKRWPSSRPFREGMGILSWELMALQ